jgi:hypothetical protein
MATNRGFRVSVYLSHKSPCFDGWVLSISNENWREACGRAGVPLRWEPPAEYTADELRKLAAVNPAYAAELYELAFRGGALVS